MELKILRYMERGQAEDMLFLGNRDKIQVRQLEVLT